MTLWEMTAVLLAGIAAGAINTIVGSGTLITFPVLLAVGLPPVTANVSNSLGLVPGSLAGAIGYRAELAGQRHRLLRFGTASLLGGLTGAALLVTLPGSAFEAVVPVLILTALVLVVLQPRVARAMAARRAAGTAAPATDGGWPLLFCIGLTGVYGGYFGAAQGVLLLALMGMLLPDDLQTINGIKNVLAVIVNGVAALFFLFTSHIDWTAALLIAAGATLGGVLGAKVGRRLPPIALRGLIVLVGLAAVTKLLFF
ncbi:MULTISPECIES: sulfite exporter TauE/SafE family protein [Kitasatospora]|uniref:sulfite exporter TauE/SafE family protein n=1 Tax=Kitasatospora TaxID=2063 RepID=UPI0004C381B2|nr:MULTISPECIES: sulfite exporter TauE/SafE family protein [unclassified Kitasatospora]WAL74445.1 sulfite exporter TauE/SafE family protein [Kitasatospora sp. YST-16]WNW40510.1 sulfite exporter TauE/SafE family protein [Streptomyces sp. Li-HN-5-13]